MADASAALGIIGRTGLGKMRHVDTSYLWLQQQSIKYKIKFQKVLGTENPADEHKRIKRKFNQQICRNVEHGT